MKHLAVFAILLGTIGAIAQINPIEKKTVEAADYNVKRDLISYQGTLEKSFLSVLASLTKNEKWIDSGAGDALAPIDYLRNGGVAKVLAVDARFPKNHQTLEALKTFEKQFKYSAGRYIQQYRPEELFPAKLITDVLGATAYASQLDEVLDVLLNSLVKGGRLYFQIDEATVPSFAAEEKNGHNVIVRIISGIRVSVPLGDWYKSIKGVKFYSDRSGDGGHETGVFIRIDGPIVVPKLKLEKYVVGSPPQRIYLWP